MLLPDVLNMTQFKKNIINLLPQEKYPMQKDQKNGRKYDKKAGGAFVKKPGKWLAEGRGKDQGRGWKTKSVCLVRQG